MPKTAVIFRLAGYLNLNFIFILYVIMRFNFTTNTENASRICTCVYIYIATYVHFSDVGIFQLTACYYVAMYVHTYGLDSTML